MLLQVGGFVGTIFFITCINWTPIVVCANHSLNYHLQVQYHLHVQKTTHHNNKHTIVRLQCTVLVHVDLHTVYMY